MPNLFEKDTLKVIITVIDTLVDLDWIISVNLATVQDRIQADELCESLKEIGLQIDGLGTGQMTIRAIT